MDLTIFERVKKFNKDAGTLLNRDSLPKDEWINEFTMLEEELNELYFAVFPTALLGARNTDRVNTDRVEVADALADIIYVCMGTMAKLGIDYERVMNEVCLSNESKYIDGKLIKNEQGKIQKGPNFRKPDLTFVKDL